jgi:hypothetical protein
MVTRLGEHALAKAVFFDELTPVLCGVSGSWLSPWPARVFTLGNVVPCHLVLRAACRQTFRF